MQTARRGRFPLCSTLVPILTDALGSAARGAEVVVDGRAGTSVGAVVRSVPCARQMDGDPGLHLDDAGGDLDEAQAQGVELGAPPRRSARQRRAQGPHQPVGVGVQEQAQLVGGHCQRKPA